MTKEQFDTARKNLIEYLENNSTSISEFSEQARSVQTQDELEELILTVQKTFGSKDKRFSEMASVINPYGPDNPYGKPQV
jgi:hypothetical protein